MKQKFGGKDEKDLARIWLELDKIAHNLEDIQDENREILHKLRKNNDK